MRPIVLAVVLLLAGAPAAAQTAGPGPHGDLRLAIDCGDCH